MTADGSFNLKSATRPASGEAPFDLSEIFFSRTDERGVIQAFNEVFVRIANYSPDKLLNAPHKLIRHPDMPKGVFWLLWHQIKRGSLVGAYVKNRAEDGLYYWVYAVVQPVQGGFISVRMKPTSPILPKVEALYAKMLRREQEEGLTPEKSAHEMMGELRALGWRNYAAFEADTISTEYQARRTGRHLPIDPDVQAIVNLLGQARIQRGAIRELNGRFSGANLLTVNMRVIATRLVDGQKTIAEIAKNYGIMVEEIKSHLAAFDVSIGQDDPFLSTPEARAVFRMCAAKLIHEAAESFRSETLRFSGIDRKQEVEAMDACAQWAQDQSEDSLNEVIDVTTWMRRRVEHLRRLIVGLSIVRIACRVESGVLNSNAEGLGSIVAKLDEIQEEISKTLDIIESSGSAGLEYLREYRMRTAPETWEDE